MDAEPRKKMAAFVFVNLANEGGLNSGNITKGVSSYTVTLLIK